MFITSKLACPFHNPEQVEVRDVYSFFCDVGLISVYILFIADILILIMKNINVMMYYIIMSKACIEKNTE